MADTVEDICNLALDMIGVDRIVSIDAAGIAAERCKRNYPLARDAVFRAFPWNSVTRQARLAADTVAPPFRWARRFPLPNGPEDPNTGSPPYCLRVVAIDGEREFFKQYQVQGRFIVTNEEGPLDIDFIGRVTDPMVYDALLVQAIATRLAAVLAFGFTKSASMVEALQRAAAGVIAEAQLADTQEGAAEEYARPDWIESRY